MNRTKTTAIAGGILGVIVAFALIAQAAIITNGLAGRWIFNEASGITANDSSGFRFL